MVVKVSKNQKAENRTAILQAAGALFREYGFDHVTVAQVMDAAGLTHGGFYGHFASKDDLFAKTLTHVLSASTAGEGETLSGYAAVYLSPEHRDARSTACPFSALGSEVARASGEARHALTQSMKERVSALSASAPGRTPDERRQAAIAGWSAMVGGLILARISDDPKFADDILEGTKRALGA
jgi:TetR/AcrR family transcriptional repressor of nem operon